MVFNGYYIRKIRSKKLKKIQQHKKAEINISAFLCLNNSQIIDLQIFKTKLIS